MGKRTIEVQDVHINKVNKLIGPPILTSFRTPMPKNVELTGTLSKEKLSSQSQLQSQYQSRLVLSGPEDMTFDGFNSRGVNGDNRHEQIFIGVLDKRTNTMQLVEAETFLVKRQLQDEARQRIGEKENVATANNRVTFGTKKNVNFHNDYMKAKDRGSENIKDSIASAAETVLETEVPTANDDEYDMFPHIYAKANCKENVYKMEDLVPLSQLQHFIATAEALLDSKQPDTAAYSELFRSCFNNARGEVAEVSLQYTCCALYCECLLKIANRTFCKYPAPLKRYFKTTFPSPKLKPTMDKALAHLMVLVTILHGYRTPQAVFSNSLVVQKPQLRKMAALLRLHVNGSFYSIDVPLPKPYEELHKDIGGGKGKKRR